MNQIHHNPTNGFLYLDIRESTGHLKSYLLDVESFLFKKEFQSLRVFGTSESAQHAEPLSFVFFLKEEDQQRVVVWCEKDGEAFTYRMVSDFAEKERGAAVLQYIIENKELRSSENFLLDSNSFLQQEGEKFQIPMKHVTSQVKGTLTYINDEPLVILII